MHQIGVGNLGRRLEGHMLKRFGENEGQVLTFQLASYKSIIVHFRFIEYFTSI